MIVTEEPIKIIFAGTPEFAAEYLKALIDDKLNIAAVFTRRDKPAGRGRHLSESPVKKLALAHGLPVCQPKTLRDPEIIQLIKDIHPDVIVDIACGFLVPKEILEFPQYGCINIHPSLLPRWRGAAPIQRAILNGDKETGVTIMKMDEGLDTGPILLQQKCVIHDTDTTETLSKRLIELGSKTLVTFLENIHSLHIKLETQSDKDSSYAEKIEKSMADIDWAKSAEEIDRQVRAFIPWPVAQAHMAEQTLRFWGTTPLNMKTDIAPGTITEINKDSLDVATGDGVLRIQTLQFPNAKPLPVSEILKSKKDFFEQHKKFNAN